MQPRENLHRPLGCAGDRETRWELFVDGVLQGPYDETFIVGAIENGDILKALVRRAGAAQWQDLKSHTPFADALRRAASTQPIRLR